MSAHDDQTPLPGAPSDDRPGATPPPHDMTPATPSPDTDRVSHYLALQAHIEALRADSAPPAGPLGASEAGAYRMAALFRAAAPGASEPDPAFAAALAARLAHEPAAAAPHAGTTSGAQRVSRRRLLARGAGVAAAAALGAAAGAALERQAPPAAPAPRAVDVTVPLVPPGTGSWRAVARLTDLPAGGDARFAAEGVVGFIVHGTEGILTLSGVCTHMGCLLNWNAAARTLDCPCHGGRFTAAGDSAPASPVAYRPLPRLATRVADGQVWVYVPAGTHAAAAMTPVTPADRYGAPPHQG